MTTWPDDEMEYADYQPACSRRTQEDRQQDEKPGPAEQPAEAWRLCPGVHPDAEEAELGPPQGRARSTHQRDRGHHLHPGRRSQPAGALAGADSRRPRQGSPGRSLSRGARHPRCGGRAGADAGTIEIRREAAEEGLTTRVRRVEPRAKRGFSNAETTRDSEA